jgi:hypothetical protein
MILRAVHLQTKLKNWPMDGRKPVKRHMKSVQNYGLPKISHHHGSSILVLRAIPGDYVCTRRI